MYRKVNFGLLGVLFPQGYQGWPKEEVFKNHVYPDTGIHYIMQETFILKIKCAFKNPCVLTSFHDLSKPWKNKEVVHTGMWSWKSFQILRLLFYKVELEWSKITIPAWNILVLTSLFNGIYWKLMIEFNVAHHGWAMEKILEFWGAESAILSYL